MKFLTVTVTELSLKIIKHKKNERELVFHMYDV